VIFLKLRPTFTGMKSQTLKTYCILFLLFLASSCETEFNPNITSETTPLVYGIIAPGDSLYYIRLTKTFIGAGNALDYARVPDSIYYPGAKVFLETRTLQGDLIQQVQLEDYVIEDREPGIFATSPNHIFRTDASAIQLRQEYFTRAGRSYDVNLHVKAVIPGYRDTVHSATRLRLAPKLTIPRSTFVKVYFYGEYPFWMEWIDSNKESMFQILVRVHYKDFLYDSERDMVTEWVLTGIQVNMTSFPDGIQKVYSYYFRPEHFFNYMQSAIKNDPEVLARVCGKLDFVVLSCNKELEDYRNVYALSDDYHGAGFTNVENGYGLFTTYSTVGIYGMTMGPQELDSLASGQFTRKLKFKNY